MPALAGQWEKQGEYYFLAKDDRSSFSAAGLGANKFTSKYLRYDGIDFLVRGADNWQDYGRLDLTGNKMFAECANIYVALYNVGQDYCGARQCAP